MPDLRQVLRVFPMRKGLLTAGQQGTIAEGAAWLLQNVSSRLDGLLERRPGLQKWGQTLKYPSKSADLPIFATFRDLESWLEDDSSANGKIRRSLNDNKLTLAVDIDSVDRTYSLRRSFIGTESASSSDDWSLRISIKGTNLVDYDGSDTTPAAMTITAIAAAGSGKRFALMKDGLYYQAASDDTYVLITEADVMDDEKWHALEIQMDKDGNTAVTVDDNDSYSITSSAIKSVTPTGDVLDIDVRTDTSTRYYIQLADVMFAATVSSPFSTSRVDAVNYLSRRTNAGNPEDVIMAITNRRLWADRDARNYWHSVMPLPYARAHLSRYKDEALIVNSHKTLRQSTVYLWDGGRGLPEQQDTAPPIAFAVEHKSRIWGAGDKRHPLRVYFSGNRQPNVWFHPESDASTTDNLLEAGFIDIPSDGSDEITALFGDYFGQLVIFTRRSVWKLHGDNFDTFAVVAVNRSRGCLGPEAVEQVGNDLFFQSREGVHSLATTEQYGDLLSQNISIEIQDVWSQIPAFGFRLRDPDIMEAKLAYLPIDNLVYVPLHRLNETESQIMLVYNPGTKQWLGPWIIESSSVALLEFTRRTGQFIMHGRSNGIVAITDRFNKTDMGEDYTVKIVSPKFSGRSIDPSLSPRKKIWKELRLYIMPRGEWDFTVSWIGDSGDSKSTDIDQNFYEVSTITNNFRLNDTKDGLLQGQDTIAPLEITLDTRARWLSFTIEQSGGNQDFILQGYDLEFLPGRTEAE